VDSNSSRHRSSSRHRRSSSNSSSSSRTSVPDPLANCSCPFLPFSPLNISPLPPPSSPNSRCDRLNCSIFPLLSDLSAAFMLLRAFKGRAILDAPTEPTLRILALTFLNADVLRVNVLIPVSPFFAEW
jgi:hypothetical protein